MFGDQPYYSDADSYRSGGDAGGGVGGYKTHKAR